MIQSTLAFSTEFNAAITVPKFVLTDLSPYAGEGIALTNVAGVFQITGPAGIIYNNTNFASPDISPNSSTVFNTVSIPLDTFGNIVNGTYIIQYTIMVTGGVQAGTYILTHSYTYCYVAPVGSVQVTSSLTYATVTSTDLTNYTIGPVNPSLARTHTVYYPPVLNLSPLVGSSVAEVINYPNVWTGVYTGKISTIATYTFTDGLIVAYLITANNFIDVENSSLCDIYCGLKAFVNTMQAAYNTGDFKKADYFKGQLSLIAVYMQMYDQANACGQTADAAGFLAQIMLIANITEGCGCGTNTPTQIIPIGGGGSGNTVIVQDDSLTTHVTSNTVGSTTTYTVAISSSYKALILGALQAMDFSVATMRAAGIPEEARGTNVTTLPAGGGTLTLSPGVSKGSQVISGNPTMTAGFTVNISGTPIDGDEFQVFWEATPNPNGQTVTIFGISLSPTETSSGDVLVVARYAASNATWYAVILNRSSASASQSGLFQWVNGSDYTLGSTVLGGTNPSYVYVNILAAGSGSNPPTGTTSSNTYWKFVGNKSALYSSSNTLVFDVTSGIPYIYTALPSGTTGYQFVVITGGQLQVVPQGSINIAGSTLALNNIFLGNSSSQAVPVTLNTTLLRSLTISGVSGSSFNTFTLPPSGTVTKDPQNYSRNLAMTGTTTLTGDASIVGGTASTNVAGDYFWLDVSANITLAGNILTLFGVVISAAQALVGNYGIFAYWDSSLSQWTGRLITYGVTIPPGTVNETVRYSGTNILSADPNTLQDGLGNNRFAKSLVVGASAAPTSEGVIVGDTTTDTGDKNISTGTGHTISSTNSKITGNANVVSGNSQDVSGGGHGVSGSSHKVSGQSSTVSGTSNNVSGNSHTVSNSYSFVTGLSNIANGFVAFIRGAYNVCTSFQFVSMAGQYGQAFNNFAEYLSGGLVAGGLNQKESVIMLAGTTNATPAIATLPDNTFFNIPLNCVQPFSIVVAAIQKAGSAGTVGDSHSFFITGVIKNVAGTLTIVGSPAITSYNDSGASAWTAVPTAGTSTLTITVTGEANKTINWTVSIVTVKAGY